jgi:hypothetical protein
MRALRRTAARPRSARRRSIGSDPEHPLCGLGPVARAQRATITPASFVVELATASAFRTLADTLIETDYLALMGGASFADVFLNRPLGPIWASSCAR